MVEQCLAEYALMVVNGQSNCPNKPPRLLEGMWQTVSTERRLALKIGGESRTL
jgi:hypothetical protein